VIRDVARSLGTGSTADHLVNGSAVLSLKKGDQVEVEAISSVSADLTASASVNYLSIARETDLSVYGVQGQVEILSATSAVKSGITSGAVVDLTGNGLPLTPGIWRLNPSPIRFSQSSTTVTYTRVAALWRVNPPSTSAVLSSSAAIQLISATDAEFTDHRNISTSSTWVINSSEYIIKVTSPITVYLHAFAEASGTLADARVTSFPTAQRIA
jgi:hypothetical protein